MIFCSFSANVNKIMPKVTAKTEQILPTENCLFWRSQVKITFAVSVPLIYEIIWPNFIFKKQTDRNIIIKGNGMDSKVNTRLLATLVMKKIKIIGRYVLNKIKINFI
jgi:hypothetical protein